MLEVAHVKLDHAEPEHGDRDNNPLLQTNITHLLDLNNSYATFINEVLPVLGILLYINTWDGWEGWSPEFVISLCLLCLALSIKFTSSNLR